MITITWAAFLASLFVSASVGATIGFFTAAILAAAGRADDAMGEW